MKSRSILAHISILCAATALTACTSTTRQVSYNTTQSVALQPTIIPASAALNEVTSALDVSVRQINATSRPASGTLASIGIQPKTVLISRRLQCVPFARERSGVAIRGNANTWWKQAAGDFVRVKAPTVGAVMVMNTRRGHVGVVTKIVDARTVVIDHSNWLSNGQIYLDQPVMDVSANNDWSKVVVWHPNLGKFGSRALTVSGFIVDAPARGNATVYASLSDVPSSLTSGIQYAAATPLTGEAPAAVPPAATVVLAAAKVETPVAPVAPAAPAPALRETVEEAPVQVAEAAPAKPVYVNTIMPNAKPGTIADARAVAMMADASPAVPAAKAAPATEPVRPAMVSTIIPSSKPGHIGKTNAPVAVARAEHSESSAHLAMVSTVIPTPKPSVLGANQPTVVAKGEALTSSNAAAVAFVPTGKPKSIATFR